jgi:hypothetical protein
MGAAAAVPASAAALPSGTKPTGTVTRAEWEAGLTGKGGGVSPDLCAYECGGNWGAYSHAETDAFNHGDYSELRGVECYYLYPEAKKGEEQWNCGGEGAYGGKWYGWSLDLSPFGYSKDGYYPH